MVVNFPVFISKHKNWSSLDPCEKKTNDVFREEVPAQGQVARNVTRFLALSAPIVEASLRMLSLGGILSVPLSGQFSSALPPPPAPAVSRRFSSCEVDGGAIACFAAAGSRMASRPHLQIPLFTDRSCNCFPFLPCFLPSSSWATCWLHHKECCTPMLGCSEGRVSMDSRFAAFSRRCKMICSSSPLGCTATAQRTACACSS